MSEEQQQPVPANQIFPETPENSLSQAEVIKLLQETIQQLESCLERLKKEPLESLPSKASLEILVADIQTLAASVQTTQIAKEINQAAIKADTSSSSIIPTSEAVSQVTATVEEPEAVVFKEPDSWLDRFLPNFDRLQAWWDGTLAKIRSLLPTALNEKLSDLALTGILTGTIITLLLTTVVLLPQPSTQVVNNPPEVIETPPELKAPEAPKSIEVAPPPQPELTPEQSLIAAIQEQVSEITSQYSEVLIRSIEANFLQSRLLVTVGDDWYKLNNSKQNKLANEILSRSQKLDFRKLEIINSEGTLLARNPVVGKTIVILQREKA